MFKLIKPFRKAFVLLAVLYAGAASWHAWQSGRPDPVLGNAQEKLASSGKAAGPITKTGQSWLSHLWAVAVAKVQSFNPKSVAAPNGMTAVLLVAVAVLAVFAVFQKVSQQAAVEKAKGRKGRGR